jgi:RND family efflux transporter MFP subunit
MKNFKHFKLKESMVKFGIVLFLFTLILIGCGGQELGTDSEISVPVSVEEIKLKPIEEFITSTGTVNAQQEVLIQAETAGYYRLQRNPKTGKNYALGDIIKRGEVIIKLENPEYENNIKIESQRLNLDISKREFEKQQSLYEKGGVTLRELKDSERTFIEAKYTYDNAIIQLNKLKISSSFDGVIVDIPYYTQGTKITTNMEMLKVMNYSQLYLELNLPGKDLTRLKVGQAVRVTNYSIPDDTLNGRVNQVSPAIDATTRSFKATVNIDNPNLVLRPGMFVKSEIIVARKDSAIVIPKDIIISQRRGKTVYIVARGAAEDRVITTGLENPDVVEVVEGLNENERLVIKGFETLRDHSKVKIIR